MSNFEKIFEMDEKTYFDEWEDSISNFNEKKQKEMLEGFSKVVSCKCRTWFCPNCKQWRGFKLRSNMLKKASMFNDPRLLTLTIHTKRFSTPEEAYLHVTQSKLLPRLFRYLGIKRYIWVLEFTKKGWPHWHILIDVDHMDSKTYKGKHYEHFIDFDYIRSLWTKWGCGSYIFVSEKKAEFLTPAHAINYITKYMIKMPESGFPNWVMHRQKRIRFVQASKALGALMTELKSNEDIQSEVETEVEELEEKEAKTRKDRQISYMQRVDGCGDLHLIFDDENKVQFVFNYDHKELHKTGLVGRSEDGYFIQKKHVNQILGKSCYFKAIARKQAIDIQNQGAEYWKKFDFVKNSRLNYFGERIVS